MSRLWIGVAILVILLSLGLSAALATDRFQADVSLALVSAGDAAAAGEGLRAAQGMLRRHLAMTLNLRITPELLFYADGSIAHGARIAKLLDEIGVKSPAAEEGEGENGDA